jgi:hypothetical protein
MDDSNFQQRVDSTKNEEGEQAGGVLTIKVLPRYVGVGDPLVPLVLV